MPFLPSDAYGLSSSTKPVIGNYQILMLNKKYSIVIYKMRLNKGETQGTLSETQLKTEINNHMTTAI